MTAGLRAPIRPFGHWHRFEVVKIILHAWLSAIKKLLIHYAPVQFSLEGLRTTFDQLWLCRTYLGKVHMLTFLCCVWLMPWRRHFSSIQWRSQLRK